MTFSNVENANSGRSPQTFLFLVFPIRPRTQRAGPAHASDDPLRGSGPDCASTRRYGFDSIPLCQENTIRRNCPLETHAVPHLFRTRMAACYSSLPMTEHPRLVLHDTAIPQRHPEGTATRCRSPAFSVSVPRVCVTCSQARRFENVAGVARPGARPEMPTLLEFLPFNACYSGFNGDAAPIPSCRVPRTG